MIKMGIRTKIIILILIAGFVPFVIAGMLGYRTASLSLKKQAFSQLVSVREAKKKQIEDYFSNIRKQIQTFSENRMIIDAMKEFKDAFNEFQESNPASASQLEEYRTALWSYYTGDFTDEYKRRNNGRNPDAVDYLNQIDDDSAALQYFYISANHNPPGEKHRLDFAGDNSAYSRLHGNYHPIIRNYLEKFGYHDIFLVDPESGDIVYSVFKELDFSTSLKDGPYAKTNIGSVFREVNDSNDPNYVKLVDYEPYPPSYEDAASFIASPVFDGTEKVGVLIFQMPIDKINMVMTGNNNWRNVGLGESGETYLIGCDFTMRNQSRFIIEDKGNYFEQLKKAGTNQGLLNTIKAKESTILLQKVKTKGTEAANSGETNIEIFPDYRNVLVLSAYAPLDIKDIKWSIMSEIDKEEALKPVTKLTNNVFKVAGIAGILIVLAVFLSVRITKPIKKLIEGTKKIAEGDLTFRIRTEVKDEIGYLANSFNEMTSKLRESKKQLLDYAGDLEEKVEEKTSEIRKISHAIEQSSSTILITNAKGSIEYVNPRFTQLTSYTPEEAIGKNPGILKSGKTPPEAYKELWKTIMSGKEWRGEFCNKKKNGELYWESASISPVKNKGGFVTHFIAIKDDITEQKRKDEQIKASLKEKEVLLKEIHHRVKNNMQVISSLLNLQSKSIKDKRLLDIFKECQNRVKSMALIHEGLYKTKDLAKIDYNEYVQTLISRLIISYVADPDSISLNVSIDNIFLGVDVGIPCGLIINELFTNSVKYAFPEGKKGEICISFHSDKNKYTLVYSDNGIGLPEDFDFRNTKTLGLELVNILTQQLGGTIKLDRAKGTVFKIVFGA